MLILLMVVQILFISFQVGILVTMTLFAAFLYALHFSIRCVKTMSSYLGALVDIYCFNCIFLFESYYCIWFLCFFVGTNKAHAKCVQQREEQIQKGLWELEGKWFECISPTFPERWLVLEGWYILQRSESQLQGNSQSKRQLFIIPSLLSFGSWQVRISVFKKLNCNEYWQ